MKHPNREKVTDYPEPRFCGYVGMPKALYLESFARYVRDIFSANVYLVGSALETKEWHDLDVVVVLSDEEWSRYEFGDPENRFKNKKWIAYCMAISNLGKELVDCEVDFQVHQMSYNNKVYKQEATLEIG